VALPEQLALELARTRTADVKAVMSTPAGRRFVLRLFGAEFAGLEEPNAEATDFLRGVREGQRSIAQRLHNELLRAAQDEYLLARGESLAEQKRVAELLKTSK
jgi:hypothetical protein